MKITTIKVSRGATINMGNYESARVDVGAEATVNVEDGDDVSVEGLRANYNRIDAQVREMLVDGVADIKGSARGESPRRFVEGV